MQKFSIYFLLLFLVSCTSLKPDPVIPAIKAGYPTLEFLACGKLWHGLGICSLDSTDDYNKIGLKIQGYFKGTGRVVSQNCGIDRVFSYVDNQLIPINIPGSANQSCIVSVTLSPEYPDESKSGLVIYSLRGHLAIKVKGPEDWSGHIRKVTGKWKSKLKVDVGGQGEVRVIMRGCGVAYDTTHDVSDGLIQLELSKAVLRARKGLCILEGVVIDPEFEDFLFTVMVAQYATELPDDPKWKNFRFLPLATPAIRMKKRSIKVSASEVVSVLSLDGKYRITRERKFKFKQDQNHILRAVTIKGRSVLGFWNAKLGRWRWVQ